MAPTESARSDIRARDVGSCASYAFSDSLTRASLAFTAIFTLGGLIILVAYVILAVRRESVRKAAPWSLFGIGIFLWTLSWVLSIAQFVIQECNATTYGDATTPLNLGIALNWVYMASMIMFLATALCPICDHLYRNQGSTTFQRLKWPLAIVLFMFGAIYVSSTAYYTWIAVTPNYNSYSSYYYNDIDFRLVIWYRLSAARSFIQAIAALVAGSTITGAWNLSRRMGARSTGLIIGTVIFTLSLFVDSIGTFGLLVASLVQLYNFSSSNTTLSATGLFAINTVFNMLELIAWAALLAIAASQAMGQESYNGDKPYQYAPAPFHSGGGAPEIMNQNTTYQPQAGFGQQTSYDSAGPRQDYQLQQEQQNRHSGISPGSPPMGQQQYQAYAPQTGSGQQHTY